MNRPLVSVVCLSHNHNEFVEESIQSVLDQDYENVELIVVDDASTDGTTSRIKRILQGTAIKFISLHENVGNCRAFNRGFQQSSGDYIIDLAADDVLLPNRITDGLKSFNSDKIGVSFCDAHLTDRSGEILGTHFERTKDGILNEEVSDGDIYETLIHRYFISAPTMMIRRQVLEQLDGYDENLSYEDFDFWIRSSRNWYYSFTNEILVKKRLVKNSHASSQFRFLSKHQRSTLEVCKKIKKLNRSTEEDQALKKRCRYEIRQCLRQGNWRLIPAFLSLARS
ncbi:MAG: glycosyltransferase [Cyclobacteriaceae bacterium]